MGVYAITGASSGIGAKTKELLLQKGHEVINIDLKDGDICVNLATPEGRQAAVDKLHELHAECQDFGVINTLEEFFKLCSDPKGLEILWQIVNKIYRKIDFRRTVCVRFDF